MTYPKDLNIIRPPDSWKIESHSRRSPKTYSADGTPSVNEREFILDVDWLHILGKSAEPCFAYAYSVVDHPELIKVGITQNIETRRETYYDNILWKKQLDLGTARVAEFLFLNSTYHKAHECPPKFNVGNFVYEDALPIMKKFYDLVGHNAGGITEVRIMTLEEVKSTFTYILDKMDSASDLYSIIAEFGVKSHSPSGIRPTIIIETGQTWSDDEVIKKTEQMRFESSEDLQERGAVRMYSSGGAMPIMSGAGSIPPESTKNLQESEWMRIYSGDDVDNVWGGLNTPQIAKITNKQKIRDKDKEQILKHYKHYQDLLLQATQKNRSVLLRRIYNKHSFDLFQLENKIVEKLMKKAVKNILGTLNDKNDEGEIQNIVPDSKDEVADPSRVKLTTLSRNLRQIEEETGQQTGYFGFPFLQGRPTPDLYVRGPVVLFPISIEYRRRAKNGGWHLRFVDKRPILNGALFAALKKKGKYDFPDNYEESFDELIEDMARENVEDAETYLFQKIFNWLQDIISLNKSENQFEAQELSQITTDEINEIKSEHLHLVNYKIMGNFPQANDKIYRDYQDLIQNVDELEWGIVSELMGVYQTQNSDEGDSDSDSHSDQSNPPNKKLNLVLASDSSQEEVILESKKSDLIVVRGPPGTGKSQVIVNLISDALTNQKKVLVVCQKRAALEVIKQRLAQVDLDRYAVFLEKELDDRVKMYRQLYEIIESSPPISTELVPPDTISAKMDECVSTLSSIGQAMRKEYFGTTAHKLYSKADGQYLPQLDLTDIIENLNWSNHVEFLEHMKVLERNFKRFETKEHPWFGRKGFTELGIKERGEIHNRLKSLIELGPMCVLASSQKDQIRLETLSGMVAMNSTTGINLADMIQQTINKIPDTVIMKSAEIQRRLENHSSGIVIESTTGTNLAYMIQQTLNKIPSAMIRKSAEKQRQLNKLFTSHVEDPGFLGRNRKKVAREIEELLHVENADIEFVKKNFDGVKKGVEFWDVFSKLLNMFNESKQKELISMIEEPDNLSTYLTDTKAVLLEVNNGEYRLDADNREKIKKGVEFWDVFSKLLNMFNESSREELVSMVGEPDNLYTYLTDTKAVLLEVNNGEYRLDADNREKIKKGVEFWDVFSKLLDMFDESKQKELVSMVGEPDKLASYLSSLKVSNDELHDLQEFDKKKMESRPGLFAALHRAQNQFDETEDWSEKIKQEIYSHWLDAIERDNTILKGDIVSDYNMNRVKLSTLMKQKQQSVIKMIQYRIESTIHPTEIYYRTRNKTQREWKEFSAELKKKRRVKPVRKLIEMYKSQFFQIAPCWLASPESVSKVFPLEKELFDLVIVDEASQLSMERAIPFLYRGKHIVVAGDEKQLPPFDLFQISEDGGDETITTEKSLLESAKAKYNTCNLQWHYRSKYQELIDFSNHAFYNGTLNIVPNAINNPDQIPLKWIKCDGIWENNKNHIEAERVVDEIKEVLSEGTTSVGVITFNEAQQDLINDRIDRRLDTDAGFYELYKAAKEERKDNGIFIKNIENVQGDERDVIIFSVAYAKDPNGRFANRFGLLNQKGGENRLNVAITRARSKMVVVSSIEPTDIKPNSTHMGPRFFRQFLDYVKATHSQHKEAQEAILEELNPDMARKSAKTDVFDSPFEIEVCDKLRSRGYHVDTQIGFSGYRIDLGIVHPEDKNRYVLGIECDGATFHSAKNVKERDVMRQEFLESKGWKIARIWSKNWWINPNKEIDRIVSRIDAESNV